MQSRQVAAAVAWGEWRCRCRPFMMSEDLQAQRVRDAGHVLPATVTRNTVACLSASMSDCQVPLDVLQQAVNLLGSGIPLPGRRLGRLLLILILLTAIRREGVGPKGRHVPGAGWAVAAAPCTGQGQGLESRIQLCNHQSVKMCSAWPSCKFKFQGMVCGCKESTPVTTYHVLAPARCGWPSMLQQRVGMPDFYTRQSKLRVAGLGRVSSAACAPDSGAEEPGTTVPPRMKDLTLPCREVLSP